MGYYVRAFCTSPKVPELAAIQRWLRERGSTAVLDEPTHAVEVARSAAPSTPILALDTSEWEQVGVAYKPGRLPILAECSRDDGTSESLLRQEVDEFIELIGDATPDGAKQRVLKHLRVSKFISSPHPTSTTMATTQTATFSRSLPSTVAV